MESIIQDWGYIALFLYSFGGGMLAIAVGGVLSSTGDLNILYVILIASISNFIGDLFLFTIARKNKSYAKEMMKNHQRKIAYTHILMRKYGAFVIFIQKYLYGVKTLVPLAMGLTKYNINNFIVYNFFASAIWGILIGGVSYSLGNVVIEYLEDIKEYAFVLILAILLTLFYFYKKK
jgi:membrane protein DedA with SNARE-associated domain